MKFLLLLLFFFLSHDHHRSLGLVTNCLHSVLSLVISAAAAAAIRSLPHPFWEEHISDSIEWRLMIMTSLMICDDHGTTNKNLHSIHNQLHSNILLPAGFVGKLQTAGIKFTHRLKISIFVPQGRLVAPIWMKFGMAEGHVGLLAVQNFTPIGAQGWKHGPQKVENFHVLVKSRPTGANSLTNFYNC